MTERIAIVCTTGKIVRHDIAYTLLLGTLLKTGKNNFMVTEGCDIIVYYKQTINNDNVVADDGQSVVMLFDNDGGTFKVGTDLVICESDDIRILVDDAVKANIIKSHADDEFQVLKPVKLPKSERAVLNYFKRTSK